MSEEDELSKDSAEIRMLNPSAFIRKVEQLEGFAIGAVCLGVVFVLIAFILLLTVVPTRGMFQGAYLTILGGGIGIGFILCAIMFLQQLRGSDEKSLPEPPEEESRKVA